MPDRKGPPRTAVRLIEWRLPSDLAEAIVGDLEHEYHDRVGRTGRRLGANAWYWWQAVTIRKAALRRAARSVEGIRQSTVRSKPGRMVGASSLLDVKIGLRMLFKYPGITGAAVFALAIAIPAGLGPTHFIDALIRPLPEDDGERIQVLRNVDAGLARAELTSSDDYRFWVEELTSFEAIGAAVPGISYNVFSEDGSGAPVPSAQVTASTFRILRTPPLHGRTLLPEDETAGAPAVALIGYELWQSRFGADPGIVGRSIRLGRVPHSVVGVMPEGFLFVSRDQLWLPLRTDDPAEQEAAQLVFGRLSEGVSADEAQAEFSALGQRMATEFPDTHARLRPEVVPFAIGYYGLPRSGVSNMPAMYVLRVIAMLVLVVACANIGMLLFTRTVTRAQELSIRSALGASRSRIVSQFFTEALVFSVIAAGLGLLLANWLSGQFEFLLRMAPYWADLSVTSSTAFWALGLAAFSAALVGVIPALKMTGKSIQKSIQKARAGRSGVRFGGVSSALIVADVALAVATLGLAAGLWDGLAGPTDGIGALSEQFLAAELSVPNVNFGTDAGANDPPGVRLGATQEELVRRLVSEPGVISVAFGTVLPGGDIQRSEVELAESQSGEAETHEVRPAYLSPEYFDAFERPILQGRGFSPADLQGESRAVVVNTAFVDRVLMGRNPIGRLIRYSVATDEPPGPDYEIVGVVSDLGIDDPMSPGPEPGVYHPLVPGGVERVALAVRLAGDPVAFAPRLRAVVTEVNPNALLSSVIPLDELGTADENLFPWIVRGVITLTLVLLALSVSGIYALMSFTVTERTREIGIRSALGAHRVGILRTVARRALAQLAIGVVVGMAIAVWILTGFQAAGRVPTNSPVLLTLLLGAGVSALVGVAACAGPTRRALRIPPTEALREGA